jgi:pimeloyl-ACP methyl ester carboxylesterase
MLVRSAPAVLVVSLLAALAPGALAAPPAPFGHACAPSSGALLCATGNDAARVPSFDGVPLDVDVWLPATGDGPFPTIAMLHGFGGSKTAFEGGDPAYNAAFFARNGYAVVAPSARGFGRSCGVPDSRTGACTRGWIHLDDQRFEAHDVQFLLGTLVDEGVAKADALGVTGVSYGGGTSLQLAILRNRVRLLNGTTGPWTSPAGVPLTLAAAWPRLPWSDLADALAPNGRLGANTFASPFGVEIQAYNNGLYASGNASGFFAPLGADPSADITAWKNRLEQGEPYGADARAALRQLHTFHGAFGISLPKPQTPLLIQQGWTDDLFPVGQGLRIYDLLRRADARAPVALQLGDLGHARGANHPRDIASYDAQGLAFLNARLRATGSTPAPGSVTSFGESCPRSAPSGASAVGASSFARLARGRIVFGQRGAQRVTSAGGDATLSAQLNPLTLDSCRGFRVDVARGTAIANLRSRGFRLLGMTRITAAIRVRGRDALLVGRLWDVSGNRQRLIDRGVIRLRSRHRLDFHLNGNDYRVARRHRVQLELVGRDAPTYRATNDRFTVTVRNLRVTLPTRERHPRR